MKSENCFISTARGFASLVQTYVLQFDRLPSQASCATVDFSVQKPREGALESHNSPSVSHSLICPSRKLSQYGPARSRPTELIPLV